jgi:hypothetical protein
VRCLYGAVPCSPPGALPSCSIPAELGEFRARQRKGSPHYTIYLGFGQDLSAGRPKEKSLVLVKVGPRSRVEVGSLVTDISALTDTLPDSWSHGCVEHS